MRTVFFVAAQPPPTHGQAAINGELVKALSSRQVDLKILNTSPGSLIRGPKYHLTRVARVARAAWTMVWSQSRRPVLYTVFDAGLGVVYGLLVVLIARVLRCEVVVHHHTAFHCFKTTRSFKLFSLCVGKNATHVVLSDQMATDLLARYSLAEEHILVLQNAAFYASEQTWTCTKQDGAPLIVGIFSNLCVSKGALEAFSAYQRFSDASSNCRLIVAGPVLDSPTAAALQQLQKRCPREVEYWGALDAMQKKRLFRTIDVLLFPSRYRYEAQPLVVIEAFQAGVHCLSTDAGYIPELLGSPGDVCPLGCDYPGWAATRLAEISDKERLIAVRTAARDRFRKLAATGAPQLTRVLDLVTAEEAKSN